MQEGTTATNPQTGEKVVLRGGQWVPMEGGQPQPAPDRIYGAPKLPDPQEPPSGYRPQGGGLAPIPGGPADPYRPGGELDPNKPGGAGKVTEGERTAAFLATRLETAARQMAGVLEQDSSAASPSVSAELAGMFGKTARNYANSSTRQQIEAAQLDFLDSALTLGTGAAYTREQIEGYRQSYFPQLGDTDETIASKQTRLRALLMSARVKAGGATPQIDQAIDSIFGPQRQTLSTVDNTPGKAKILTEGDKVEYSTDTDREFTALAEAAFRDGADRDELDALAAKYGRPPFGPDLDRAIQTRSSGGIITFTAPQSGVKDVSAEQRAVGEFSANPGGAAVIGAGNGLLLGGSDEVFGTIRGLATGQPIGQSIAEADLQKQIIAETNPVAYGAGNVAGGVGTSVLAGGALARLGLSQAPMVLSGPAIAADIGTGAIAGGLESNTNRLGGAMLGGAAGVAGGVTGRSLGKAIAPTGGASRPLYAQGVEPTLGQRFGGMANWAEETLGSIPVVGGAVRGARQQARDQFETGAFNQALGEIGLKLPKGVKNGQEAHRFAQNRFSDAYDKAREGLAMVRDEQFIDNYKALAEEIAGGGLSKDSANRFRQIVTAQVDRRLKDGRLEGDALKQVQSALGKRIAAIRNSQSGDQELAGALESLSTIIDDAARRNSPAEAVAALDAADRGYAQLVRIETASGMGAIDEAGRFTPKQYAAAVKKDAGGRATRSKAWLRGDALGQEYADAGLRLADKVPNSGSPERQMAATAILGGMGAVAPKTLAIPAAASLPYLPGVRGVTNALIAPRTGVGGRLLNPLGNALADPTRLSLAGPNALLLANQN